MLLEISTVLPHGVMSRGMLRIAAEAKLGKDGRDAVRVTTTFSRGQKAELDRVAKQKGVKVAWLVRRSVEKFLEDAAGGPMLPLDLNGGEDAKR
jgi:hypothetical protein